MVLRFESPVEGVDPITGDRFTSDRHLVLCSEIHQTHEWTRFITEGGSETARWPTSTASSPVTTTPAPPDAHSRPPSGTIHIDPVYLTRCISSAAKAAFVQG